MIGRMFAADWLRGICAMFAKQPNDGLLGLSLLPILVPVLSQPGVMDKGDALVADLSDICTADDESLHAIDIGCGAEEMQQLVDLGSVLLPKLSDIGAMADEQLHIGQDLVEMVLVLPKPVGVDAS